VREAERRGFTSRGVSGLGCDFSDEWSRSRVALECCEEIIAAA
jgi:hypothetical protein